MKDFFERFGTLLILIFLVLAKAALLGLFIQFGPIGLGPDEAQYWTWSQDLSYGYYSKPPAIAWQIWLGTHYFGNTELGVRFGSIVLSTIYPILIYFLAWGCGLTPFTCFFAAAMMALSPLGIAGGFFAITDGGMILFWILACMSLTFALSQNKQPNYIVVGLFIALGALFKWPIYLLWVFILCLFPFAKQLITKQFFLGLAISLLGLLPSLFWNMTHDFATFKHVFSTVYVPKVTTMPTHYLNGNFLDFFGAQAALVSPLLFILLLASFWIFCKENRQLNPGLWFCGGLTFFWLIIYLFVSLFKKMQGNWVEFAYPTAFVFLAWYCCERLPRLIPWMKAGIALSIFLCLFIFSYPSLQQHLPFKTPYKINPFKHNLGWTVLQEQLKEVGYNSEEEFLFSDKYQTTSILSFYGEGQKRAFFLNLQGNRLNQFSFWEGLKELQLHKNGFFVLTENSPHLEKMDETFINQYKENLNKYFAEVEYLEKKPLFTIQDVAVKESFIFKCIDYNGLEPEKSDLY